MFLLLFALLLVGCQRENIRVYDAPKEAAAARTDLPAGWEQLPSDQMSVGKFAVRGQGGAKAQITITPLPPAAGKPLENVNRWRAQLGLAAVEAGDLASQMEMIQVAGHPAALFEMAGTAPDTQQKTRIIAAMQNRDDAVWFFKMMGEDQLVRSQKGAFTNFVSRYPLPHDHDHAERGEEPSPAAAPATTARSPVVQWKTPAGWAEAQPGPMQDAKFSAAGGKAAVTVSVLDNSGGELRANVDRWRGQIGLPPVADAELQRITTTLDLNGTKATVVDMTGPKQRLVAAIVPRGDRTWFFKLLGDPDAVAAEKSPFIEFVKTTK